MATRTLRPLGLEYRQHIGFLSVITRAEWDLIDANYFLNLS